MPIKRNYRGYREWSQAGAIILTAFFLTLAAFSHSVVAESCESISDADDRADCYGEEIASLEKKQDDLLSKINQYKKDQTATQSQLAELQAEINSVKASLVTINENLVARRDALREKLQLRDRIVRAQYQSGRLTSLEFFLLNAAELNGFQYSTLAYIFDKSLADEALKIIDKLNTEISNFERDKASAEKLEIALETDQQSLVALKAQLDAQRASAEQEAESVEDSIAELSAKQQAILAAKAGEGTVSGYEAAEYHLPDSPHSPGFAAMSYGAYTHYNGMSQYGAKGRADEGQDYEEILEHYYETDVKEEDDFPDEISVEGYGDMDFQEYLYGIAEMPSSWNEEALKAQAVAARTYAYGFARNDRTICTTESCQVFSKSKSDNPPSSWKSAVDDTENEILDDPATSQYSSTTGGYLNQSGWDTESGNSNGWPEDAYEKKAKSPWFYKAWYTKGYADNSDKCGRSTPWLNEDEMADILNSWRVWKKGSSSEREHISPETTNCWGGDPYSKSEMREKAGKYGDSYESVSSVSVSQGNNGQTQSVTFGTDSGSVTIAGSEFRTVFNLRAPGYVSLRSRLFDIEMED